MRLWTLIFPLNKGVPRTRGVVVIKYTELSRSRLALSVHVSIVKVREFR